MKEAVVNLGKGLPAQSSASSAFALSAGNSAQGLGLNSNANFMNSTGIMGQGFSGAQSGYGQQAGILNNLYGLQMKQYQAQQDQSSALWGGIGTAAGMIFSDENLKEDKVPIPEGDALEAVNAMPVEEWKYKDGVSDGGHHVGTYAQDFAEQTGQGDGRTINLQDAIGITMKAVQDLDAKVDRMATGLTPSGPAPAATGLRPANDRPADKRRVSANDNSQRMAVEA
jgi:hypothetical protein